MAVYEWIQNERERPPRVKPHCVRPPGTIRMDGGAATVERAITESGIAAEASL
jgi:hypothetical protein